ncbi:hypothetical protein [Streptomyces lavendulae]|uniref:hypothetical protein n=1 Tax=Streptomyces lavendulae TaxID=1914 RepID=UPI0024A49CA1|nr:hypothetical protein [Streptomyces lavendulae]GLX21497.1 hypothetical protein Slala01_51410 [Streptomyces lavendulae subsp. lavendulae]GLX28914.1 hypothetical protein Slala02_47340 [Streptomyces lavendulae subsp. lavendulae]
MSSTPNHPSKGPARRAEHLIAFGPLLVAEHGDRAAAAAALAEWEQALDAVERARPGRIARRAEPVWERAVALLGFQAASWFLITLAVVVGGVFLPRNPVTGCLVVTLAALPSALCAVRETAHETAKGALRRGRLTGRAGRRLKRCRRDALAVLVAVPMWGVWALAIQPWR